eukprot:123715_1
MHAFTNLYVYSTFITLVFAVSDWTDTQFDNCICVNLDPNTNDNDNFEKQLIEKPLPSIEEEYLQFTVSLIDSQDRDGASMVFLSDWNNYTKWHLIFGHAQNDYHIRQCKYDKDNYRTENGFATYSTERIHNGNVFRTGMTASFWIAWCSGTMTIGGGDILGENQYLSFGKVAKDSIQYVWVGTYYSDSACYCNLNQYNDTQICDPSDYDNAHSQHLRVEFVLTFIIIHIIGILTIL